MNIKINYTAYLVGDWELVLERHLFMILKSGLYAACDSLNIFSFPDNPRLGELVGQYGMTEKTHLFPQERNGWEFPAIDDLILNPADANLYLHTKGVSLKTNKKSYIPSLAWNDYMTYFDVVHYRTCVDMLSKADAVGVEFGASLSEPDKFHYSGNFWWASKAHLEKIQQSDTYIEFAKRENRYLCETIIGSVKGRYVELFNSGTDTPKTGALYFSPILRYSLDKKNIKILKT